MRCGRESAGGAAGRNERAREGNSSDAGRFGMPRRESSGGTVGCSGGRRAKLRRNVAPGYGSTPIRDDDEGVPGSDQEGRLAMGDEFRGVKREG